MNDHFPSQISQISQISQTRHRLTLGSFVGYGAGQIGGQILRDAPALILPLHMATVRGMDAALAGLVLSTALLWVVFADGVIH